MLSNRLTRHKFPTCILCILVSILAGSTVAEAFDDQSTHPQLTESAVKTSGLDLALKQQLGMADGIKASLRLSPGTTISVLELLRVGSTAEDSPACRASNHFHNPLKSYPEAAVTDLAVAST